MGELTIEQQRALALSAAAARAGQNTGQGPTVEAANAIYEARDMPGPPMPTQEQFAHLENSANEKEIDRIRGTMDRASLGNAGANATWLAGMPFAGEFMDTATGKLRGVIHGEDPQLAAEAFRRERGQFAEDHPIGAPVLGVASGIANSVPLALAAGGGLVANSTAPLLTRTAQAMTIGGVGGALEGAVSGYGAADYGDRWKGAQEGALWGGAIGGLAGGALELTVSGIGAAINKYKAGKVPAPDVPALQEAKTAAYKEATDAGITVPTDAYDDFWIRAREVLDDMDFEEDVDKQIKAVTAAMDRRIGREMSLGEVDRLRQLVWTRVGKLTDDAQFEMGSRVITELDDMIDSIGGGELMDAARLANSKYRKTQAIELAWERAERAAAVSGTGGNTENRLRSAINGIINKPSMARFFNADEIALMTGFVNGDNSNAILRRLGKVAPGGNGLMTALNLGAVAANPGMLAVSAIATGAKTINDRSVVTGMQGIRDAVATGAIPTKAAAASLTPAGAAIPGLAAPSTTQQPNMQVRGLEIYNSGVRDPAQIRAILEQEGYFR